MLRSSKDLQGYTIAASDGDVGRVHDFYFDDERWTVRYLVVDTGTWLPGRKVPISPVALGEADWYGQRLSVNLTKEQVKDSPDIDLDKPISRQYEVDYFNYYGWPYYWAGVGAWAGWAYPGLLATAPRSQAAPVAVEERGDPHLRSVWEVTGYHIQATDEEIGHVEDFIVDDETWEMRYLVVDTSNWWFGKKVLVAPRWITTVSWPERKVFVDLTRDQVKDAPEWDPDAPVNREYEERLYDYYGRPAYWR